MVVRDSAYDPSPTVHDNAGENITENNHKIRTNDIPTSYSNDDREEGQKMSRSYLTLNKQKTDLNKSLN